MVRLRLLVTLACAVPLGMSGAAQPSVEPGWIWSGAVTAHSATVKASFRTRTGAPPLLVSTRRELADAMEVAAVTTPAPSERYADRVVAEYALTNLRPETEYFAGFSPSSGTRAQLRTFGERAFSFSVAFASCAGGTRSIPSSHVSNSRVFDAIGALDPDLFIHMGDFHYYDILGPSRPIEPLMGVFRRALDRVLSQERQALLYRRTPIVYVYDDHDYGPNDADGASPTRDAARAYYASDVPHYPLPLAPKADGPIAQTFDVGRVRFLVTDGRSERRRTTKTMLGATQEAWLLQELERAATEQVPLTVWVNSVPWITPDGDSHGWGPYADERRRIGARITALGLERRLLMLSGDAHMLAFDDGRNNAHGGFVVAQAAPLDRYVRRKGGPYSHDPGVQANGQFGVLRVDDTGTTLTATLEGYRHQGNGRAAPVPGVALRVVCSAADCTLAP